MHNRSDGHQAEGRRWGGLQVRKRPVKGDISRGKRLTAGHATFRYRRRSSGGPALIRARQPGIIKFAVEWLSIWPNAVPQFSNKAATTAILIDRLAPLPIHPQKRTQVGNRIRSVYVK